MQKYEQLTMDMQPPPPAGGTPFRGRGLGMGKTPGPAGAGTPPFPPPAGVGLRTGAGDAALAAAVGKINALSPEITSHEDLASMQDAARFYNLVKRGYSLDDAFKILRFESLMEKRAAKERQAVLNSMAGKAHLSPHRAVGDGLPEVPAEIMAAYKAVNPTASAGEIRKHYAKSMQN